MSSVARKQNHGKVFAAAAENLGLKVFLGFHFNLSRNFFLMQIEIQERQKHQEGKETKTFWTKSDIFKKLKSHFFSLCVCVRVCRLVCLCVCVYGCVSVREAEVERERESESGCVCTGY